jgi:hypothetical protein
MRLKTICLGLASVLPFVAMGAADFSVTSPAFYYSINGQSPNPTLTLIGGRTYTFAINTANIHPFEVINLPAGSVVSGNNTFSGTITFTPPVTNFTCQYICSVHLFGGNINIVPPSPPPPPTVRILSFSLGTNLTVFSTGTNTYSVNPEYSTNLLATNWYALSVQTNLYQSGTNETICGKPPGSAVYIRIRAQPN